MNSRKALPRWFKWLGGLLLATVLAFALLTGLLYWQQERIVQQALSYANDTYAGKISLAGSHISPFVNFPYVSVDLEGVEVFETKDETQAPLLAVQDAYLGFDIWKLLSGDYQVKAIELQGGYLKLVQHPDGSFNLLKALSPLDSSAVTEEAAAPFNLNLKKIKLRQVDLHKITEATGTDLDAFIDYAKARLTVKGSHTMAALDARFELNVIQGADTTFIKHKHFTVHTQLDYEDEQARLTLAPSEVTLEHGDFNLEGWFDLGETPALDLQVQGIKPNFDLLIAFAPAELIPTLESYDNRGKVFFQATVKGELAEGTLPQIDVQFGCEAGRIRNSQNQKTLEDLAFRGYLRSVADTGGLAALEFGLNDFRARPETGQFSGDLKVRNFLSPEIDLQLRSQFDLDFLVDFLNLEGLSDLSGSVGLTMNFHDIIDLNQPEKSIERLNESYFTELEIRDLAFKSEAFHLPVEGVNLIGHIEGHEARIDTFTGRAGGSDFFARGRISDLPAILHHTRDSVWVELELQSALLDLAELTYSDSTQQPSVDEQIRDLRLDLGFSSSAFAFTESPNLPVGEFFIRELHAQLQHYPHELHDFRADLLIEDEDIRLIDFSGELDSSDFHFTGRLLHYDIWMNDTLTGDTELEFDLRSEQLRLKDLLVYRGENYVPEDYRHEELKGLGLRGRTLLHFRQNDLRAIDLYVDELAGKMQLHDSRFEDFRGRLHFEDEHLTAENFRGRIGRSDFGVDLYWYLGKDPALRRERHFVTLRSQRLDLNQLLAWNPPPAGVAAEPVDHDAGFSLFDLPFWDMTLRAEVGDLRYHSYQLNGLRAAVRMGSDRSLAVDTCDFAAAGGSVSLRGLFDATDSSGIYFLPQLTAKGVDLDRFMVKFDNFGQDYLVSENLHGRVNCDLSGKLRMHQDLTPIIEASEFDIGLEVIEGRLDNYEPMAYLADYFADKNLNRIRFDTLRNTFRLRENVLHIPNMTINSSLGFIELSGTQSLADDLAMDLQIKVPLALVSQAAFSKLFKRSREEIDPEQEDAIMYRDESKKVPYAHINLTSKGEEYEVKLRKGKE